MYYRTLKDKAKTHNQKSSSFKIITEGKEAQEGEPWEA
jgi:hypothetical protein